MSQCDCSGWNSDGTCVACGTPSTDWRMLRARAEKAETRVADLTFALGDSAGWFDRATIARAERDKQQGMYLDAERQCSILMQERDAAVALGKLVSLVLFRFTDNYDPEDDCSCDRCVALPEAREALADARKAGWLT